MRAAPRRLPGSLGLPVVGESLAFARNPFAFVTKRLARYGRVFKTNVLFAKTAVLAGPEAASQFADPALVARAGAMPPHVSELYAGESLPAMDGERHRARKQLVLAAFTPDALASYLPDVQRIVERRLARWVELGAFLALDGLEDLAFELICANVLGVEAGPEADALAADYKRIARAFTAVPLNFPGTRLSRALAARDRVVRTLGALVAARRAAPGADGLSRILAATADDGTRITDDEAVREVHHLVLAGYIIYAEFAAILVALDRYPAIKEQLRAESAEIVAGPLTAGAFARMPLLEHFVMEVKRTTPIVPGIFARSKAPFACEGAVIPAGWTLLYATSASMHDPALFASPDTFDPNRFAEGRAEHRQHPCAFVPHGVGPPTGHYCAGADYATLLMNAFTVLAVQGYDWTLPEQDLGYDWSVIPPVYASGLRAILEER